MYEIALISTGFFIGWLFFKRPQWVSDLFAKFSGSNTP